MIGSSSPVERQINSPPSAPIIKALMGSSQLTLSTGPCPILRLIGPASPKYSLSKLAKSSITEPHTLSLPPHHRRLPNKATADGNPLRVDHALSAQSLLATKLPKSFNTTAATTVPLVKPTARAIPVIDPEA